MEWIKVEDRLPEDGIYYVVIKKKNERWVGRASWDKSDNTWNFAQQADEYKIEDCMLEEYDMVVTDWMPLPKLPTN